MVWALAQAPGRFASKMTTAMAVVRALGWVPVRRAPMMMTRTMGTALATAQYELCSSPPTSRARSIARARWPSWTGLSRDTSSRRLVTTRSPCSLMLGQRISSALGTGAMARGGNIYVSWRREREAEKDKGLRAEERKTSAQERTQELT